MIRTLLPMQFRSRPTRIVAADDHADIRRYFSMMLPRLGYEVVGLAANGAELVELCLARRPDVIVTDIQMPGLNGLEALRRISTVAMIPSVVISAELEKCCNGSYGNAEFCVALTKPFTAAELNDAVQLAAHQICARETSNSAQGV